MNYVGKQKGVYEPDEDQKKMGWLQRTRDPLTIPTINKEMSDETNNRSINVKQHHVVLKTKRKTKGKATTNE